MRWRVYGRLSNWWSNKQLRKSTGQNNPSSRLIMHANASDNWQGYRKMPNCSERGREDDGTWIEDDHDHDSKIANGGKDESKIVYRWDNEKKR